MMLTTDEAVIFELPLGTGKRLNGYDCMFVYVCLSSVSGISYMLERILGDLHRRPASATESATESSVGD